MLKLIRRAGLAVATAGTVMTMAVAPSQASGVPAASGGPAASGAPAAAATSVIVQNVQVPVPGQRPVLAYLVRPSGSLPAGSQAGILFLHWLGQIHSDRSEFLAEATELAAQGAVSLLPQGIFPWQAAPTGKPRDVATIRHQLAAFRACLHWLAAQPYIDQARTAVVGHDYGAMYGALLANSDPAVHAAVLAAPDATWGHWFVKYWLGFTGKRAAHYKALFAGLQPVRHVSRLGDRELFQWAGQDIFISAQVRREFARQAPRARVKLYRTSDHQFTDAAQADRDTFLAHELGLTR